MGQDRTQGLFSSPAAGALSYSAETLQTREPQAAVFRVLLPAGCPCASPVKKSHFAVFRRVFTCARLKGRVAATLLNAARRIWGWCKQTMCYKHLSKSFEKKNWSEPEGDGARFEFR